MIRRCVFSLIIVTTLAALSIVAFVSSLVEMSANEISAQRTVSETASAIEPETTTEPRKSVTEVVPMEKPTEVPYQSLVASMNWDAEKSYLLTKLAMAEAEGEDTEGKALVMLVVLNRVLDEKFPDNIEEVIYQPRQFSPISNGRFDKVEPDADCWAALDLIMVDKWDESYGAIYFESESESTWHSENLDFLFRHGKHYFYTDKEGEGD